MVFRCCFGRCFGAVLCAVLALIFGRSLCACVRDVFCTLFLLTIFAAFKPFKHKRTCIIQCHSLLQPVRSLSLSVFSLPTFKPNHRRNEANTLDRRWSAICHPIRQIDQRENLGHGFTHRSNIYLRFAPISVGE